MDKNSADEILSFVIENGRCEYRDADGNYLTDEVWEEVEFEARERGLADSDEIASEAVSQLGAGPFK